MEREIALHLDDLSLLHFELSCKRHFQILSKYSSSFYKKKCLSLFPLRFARSLNPVCSVEEDDSLSWKKKYFLCKHFPVKFIHKQEETMEDGDDLKIVHRGSGYLNLRSNTPFITCNKVLHEFLSKEELSRVVCEGVEYFEIKCLKNTVKYNRATAIGMTLHDLSDWTVCGWDRNTYGFHCE